MKRVRDSVRLFPVPYRFLAPDKRFSKYQWIDVETTPANDGRPESLKIRGLLEELEAKKYGAQVWEQKFRERYESGMIEKCDTHFFVGTVHKHPAEWIIVGLFYPPKTKQPSLF